MNTNSINNRINEKKELINSLNAQIAELEQKVATAKAEMKKIISEANVMKENILLNAMIHGADFQVRHGMIAPYSHGYYVTYLPNRKFLCDFCEKITTNNSDWWNHLPAKLRAFLDEKGWTDNNYNELQKKTEAIVKSLPKKYNPNEYTPSDKYLHGNHIANGYEVDGFSNIVRGRCGGTYSSWTTGTQNELSKQLIVLRGFCADTDNIEYARKTEFWDLVKKVYAMNHMDAAHISSDLSVRMNDWAKANPSLCMETNRHYKTA